MEFFNLSLTDFSTSGGGSYLSHLIWDIRPPTRQGRKGAKQQGRSSGAALTVSDGEAHCQGEPVLYPQKTVLLLCLIFVQSGSKWCLLDIMSHLCTDGKRHICQKQRSWVGSALLSPHTQLSLIFLFWKEQKCSQLQSKIAFHFMSGISFIKSWNRNHNRPGPCGPWRWRGFPGPRQLLELHPWVLDSSHIHMQVQPYYSHLPLGPSTKWCSLCS